MPNSNTGTSGTTVAVAGALIKHTYAMTEEKVIALTESRLKSLSLLGTLVTGFSAAASAFLTKVIDFSSDASADGALSRIEGLWIVLSLVGFLVCGGIAWKSHRSRKGEIQELFEKSSVIEP